MKEITPDNIFDVMDDLNINFTMSFDVEGFVKIDATYQLAEYDEDAVDMKYTDYGHAILYAFDGRDHRGFLMAADSVSGDVLYAATSASSYRPQESRLFVIMDLMAIKKGFEGHILREDMISKIVDMLRFMSAPCYFTFMPEAIMPKDDIEFQYTVSAFVDDGYQINVGPDSLQICLGKLINAD